MANRETFVTNAAETTLSSSLASGATTINVTSTAAFPAVPFYCVIDPDVNASREVILVDSGKTATTFTLTGAASRGQDGTTDATHSSGAKVVCVPIAALWTDINDRVDAANTALTTHEADTTSVHGITDTSTLYRSGGTDVAVADGGTGASTAAAARTNLAVVGTVGGDTITASGAAVKPLVVKGAASQTANLQEWQNSSGTVLALLNPNGAFQAADMRSDGTLIVGSSAAGTLGETSVYVRSALDKGLVVRGAASQSANLAEFQDSSGSRIADVNAIGVLGVTDLDGQGYRQLRFGVADSGGTGYRIVRVAN